MLLDAVRDAVEPAEQRRGDEQHDRDDTAEPHHERAHNHLL